MLYLQKYVIIYLYNLKHTDKIPMYKFFFKRFFDFIFSVLGIICFSWLLIICAAAVKLNDPKGPVIFRQKRLGRHGKEYWMYKFRSMKVDAEKSGVYSDDKDPRITKIGLFLRKTSLDELPQMFNILRGEMSFIGFRSPLTYHPWPWEEYTEEQKKMFELRPGITGWAQVNGRKTVEWNRRIEMNCYYTEHLSFGFDMKILLMTLFKVFANSDNENKGETVKRKDSHC